MSRGSRGARRERLPALLGERILVLDGAMGTVPQGLASARRQSAGSGSATIPATSWATTTSRR